MNAFLESLKSVAAKTKSPKLQKVVSEYEKGGIAPRELNRMAAAKVENSAFFLTPTEHFEVRFLTNQIYKKFRSVEIKGYA